MAATAPEFVNPLSPNVTMAVMVALALHAGAFLFWVISVFFNQRQAADEKKRA